jgi:hypothetical protein
MLFCGVWLLLSAGMNAGISIEVNGFAAGSFSATENYYY